MKNIIRGKRPIRQNNIPDCYWQLIERCWKQFPEERPTFAEITEILKDDQYVLHKIPAYSSTEAIIQAEFNQDLSSDSIS